LCPGEPATGWEVILYSGQLAGGISSLDGQWDLHDAWLQAIGIAQTHLPLPPCWKKGDEEGKAP